MIIEVVSALILDRHGKMLMTLRRTGATRPSMWENPGGKVDEGDLNRRDALERECHEELDVRVMAGQLVSFARLDVEVKLAMSLYACRIISGDPKPNVADALDWYTPEYAIEMLPCAPATYSFYRDIIDFRNTVMKTGQAT